MMKQGMTHEATESLRPNVWVIDDEAPVRRTLSLLLERAGFGARSFESGDAARRALESEGQPEVVICDLNMPGRSGVAFLETLRRQNHDVGIVVCSGDGTRRLPETCPDATFLAKPFLPRELLEAIDREMSQGVV
ncbi:MAG: response regulator [Pseudomonadota bacterium]